jgi:hypothetical protein
MFASWLSELLSSLTPSERAHNTFAERDDYQPPDDRPQPSRQERREPDAPDRPDGSRRNQ